MVCSKDEVDLIVYSLVLKLGDVLDVFGVLQEINIDRINIGFKLGALLKKNTDYLQDTGFKTTKRLVKLVISVVHCQKN